MRDLLVKILAADDFVVLTIGNITIEKYKGYNIYGNACCGKQTYENPEQAVEAFLMSIVI